MRVKFFAVVALAALLSLAATTANAGSFWKVSEWWRSKRVSTTVTGRVDSVENRKILFKTDDGQTLQLTGRKSEKIGENRGASIRVFGNVTKPDAHYPTGRMEVRSFKVVEEAAPVAEPAPEPAPKPAPEPFAEPAPEPAPEPEPVAEPAPEPFAEPVMTEPAPASEESYVVSKGDTLAKISKKFYGTTKKWKQIAEFNQISNPKALKVGMNLKIPR